MPTPSIRDDSSNAGEIVSILDDERISRPAVELDEEEDGPPFPADFEADLEYLMKKNAELYRRLAQ